MEDTMGELVGLTQVLTEYANDAIRLLPSLVLAIIVVAIFWIAAKIGRSVTERASSRFVEDSSLQSLFGTLVAVAIIAMGVFAAAALIFPGLEAGDIIAVLGLSSVAIGFAFKDIFENFLAGILILSRRPFKIGDEIQTGDHEGRVEEITFRSTRIHTYDGQRIVVPNAEIFKNPVIVRTAFVWRRSSFAAGIAYGEDIETARKVIRRAVASCEEVIDDPAPDIFCWEHAESSVNFEVRYWTRSQIKHIVRARDQVATAIKYALDEAGIEIPFPYRTVEFFDMTKTRDELRKLEEAG